MDGYNVPSKYTRYFLGVLYDIEVIWKQVPCISDHSWNSKHECQDRHFVCWNYMLTMDMDWTFVDPYSVNFQSSLFLAKCCQLFLCSIQTSVACAVGPSITTPSTDFFGFTWIFTDIDHLKINICHILNPNLTN